MIAQIQLCTNSPCVAFSCSGESFIRDGLYDSSWISLWRPLEIRCPQNQLKNLFTIGLSGRAEICPSRCFFGLSLTSRGFRCSSREEEKSQSTLAFIAAGERLCVHTATRFVSSVTKQWWWRSAVQHMEFPSIEARHWVLALHACLFREEQAAVFRRQPVHIQKVMVDTNVAETSVIGVVINNGRTKENTFDCVRMIGSLDDVAISRATHASDVDVRDVWILVFVATVDQSVLSVQIRPWLPWQLQSRALRLPSLVETRSQPQSWSSRVSKQTRGTASKHWVRKWPLCHWNPVWASLLLLPQSSVTCGRRMTP